MVLLNVQKIAIVTLSFPGKQSAVREDTVEGMLLSVLTEVLTPFIHKNIFLNIPENILSSG